jgi:NAD(P)H dehydrogenase (quinone)
MSATTVPAQGRPDAGAVRIAVVFHSDRGHVGKLARSVADGAAQIDGAASGLHPVDELTDSLWAALDGAGAIVFGCPTYMGGPSAVFKRFAEGSLPLWAQRRWTAKVAAGFTHSQAMSGDKLNTLQYLSILAAQHGMVWVNLDLLRGWCHQQASIDDLNRLGSWLGVMSQSNGDGPLETSPHASDLRTAHHRGRLVTAATTWALAVGEPKSRSAPQRASPRGWPRQNEGRNAWASVRRPGCDRDGPEERY